ncbi:patatin-like phospholipase family protein [Actinokineospora sp. HUAS TT18]|uniref:patatin-like phospholipase family protein n=1 Tax=Actinokineospora sp. HUAS TT18 TaxID=3447451 RepID=UPI003F51EC6C
MVLGAGGIAGTAWMTGLATRLRRDGVDLGLADVIVGTSSGAMVGGMLVTGRDLDALADPPDLHSGDDTRALPPPNPRLWETLKIAQGTDDTPERELARREVLQVAMEQPRAETSLFARIAALVGGDDWHSGGLRIPVIEAGSGRREVWDRDTGVSLSAAVTAGHAFPGIVPPVVVDGRHFVDGGLWSTTNADLAAPAAKVLVLEPLAYRAPVGRLDAELASVTADAVVRFSPDEAALEAFVGNFDVRVWQPAYQAGIRQASALAAQLDAADW